MTMRYTVSAIQQHQTIRDQSTTSESTAVRLAQRWGVDYAGTDTAVILEWFRPTDGQHGYLNPNGAALSGQSWTRQASSLS